MIKHIKGSFQNRKFGAAAERKRKNCYALDTFFINSVIAEMFRGMLAFSFQQDKQCTYNVTFRRVCLTVVAQEKQLCSECTVEIRAASQQYKDIECCTTVRLWRIYFLSNNKT